ncbi:hypothetical protein FS749_007057 [Ceratobasidium sp. UAMH 11750]|nr:hypothetical protein FS749_007057 [Ceratobasidium sp. UAMH 11750]
MVLPRLAVDVPFLTVPPYDFSQYLARQLGHICFLGSYAWTTLCGKPKLSEEVPGVGWMIERWSGISAIPVSVCITTPNARSPHREFLNPSPPSEHPNPAPRTDIRPSNKFPLGPQNLPKPTPCRPVPNPDSAPSDPPSIETHHTPDPSISSHLPDDTQTR